MKKNFTQRTPGVVCVPKRKLLTSISMTVALLFIVQSCKKDSSEFKSGNDKQVANKSLVELTLLEKENLSKRALSTDSVISFGDYYLVEKDVMILKKELSEKSSFKDLGPKTSQYRSYNLVGNYSDFNINILVRSPIWSLSNWYIGLQNAINYWNTVSNSNVKLHLINDSYDIGQRIDISVQSDNGQLSSRTAAAAPLPSSDGRPGATILVNTDFINPNTGGSLTSAQATWNMIHEIGHCLGFRHTNIYSIGDPIEPGGAIQIPNTPGTQGEPNSIMNGGTALSSCFGNCFSNYDLTAINYLYSLNSSSTLSPIISGSTSNGVANPTVFRVSYISSESNLNYKWEAIGTTGTNYYYLAPENAASLEFDLPAGNFILRCTISNVKYSQAVAEKVISFQ